MSTPPDDWDALAPTFDDEADHGLKDAATRAAWRDLLLPLLPPGRCSVADLGCGTGTLSVLLAEEGHQVTGVDRSTEMLSIARSKAGSDRSGAPLFVQGDAADPPLADGSFDVVLARHILFLLPDPDRVIQRWTRLLNPGGALVLVEGFWSTGSGLRSDDLVALVGRHRSEVHLRQLAGEPLLWGKAVHDERYLIHSPA